METTTYTEQQVRLAHEKTGGKLDEMLAFLNRRRSDPMKWVNTFADLCEAAGVKESDYAIPENGTNKEKKDAYWERLMLQERVFNGTWKAKIEDTSQRKYGVWANVIPDNDRPFGFRLAYYGCACGYGSGNSSLGARPEFKDSDTAIYAFKTFTSDYEGYMYYTYLLKQQ